MTMTTKPASSSAWLGWEMRKKSGGGSTASCRLPATHRRARADLAHFSGSSSRQTSPPSCTSTRHPAAPRWGPGRLQPSAAAWRPDGLGTTPDAPSVQRGRRVPLACDRCGQRRIEPPAAMPAGREPRSPVDAHPSRTARRPRQSSRPASACSCGAAGCPETAARRPGQSANRSGRVLAALDVGRAEDTAHTRRCERWRRQKESDCDTRGRFRNSRHEGVPVDRAVLAFTRGRGITRGCVWAFRLPVLDADDDFVFETIVGLSDRRGLVTVDDALEQIAVADRRVLTVLSSDILPWRLTMVHREKAIAGALRVRHARNGGEPAATGPFQSPDRARGCGAGIRRRDVPGINRAPRACSTASKICARTAGRSSSASPSADARRYSWPSEYIVLRTQRAAGTPGRRHRARQRHPRRRSVVRKA